LVVLSFRRLSRIKLVVRDLRPLPGESPSPI